MEQAMNRNGVATENLPDKLLSRKQVAELVGVSLVWLFRAAKNPKLGFPAPFKIGLDPKRSPVRYSMRSILDWIEARRAASEAAAAAK